VESSLETSSFAMRQGFSLSSLALYLLRHDLSPPSIPAHVHPSSRRFAAMKA
jgi:hypothetical protein